MAKRFQIDKKTGEGIRRLREANNMSQNDVAKILRVTFPTVSKLESGRPPDSVNLRRLADYFDVTVDSIMQRDERGAPAAIPSRQQTISRAERKLKNDIDEILSAAKATAEGDGGIVQHLIDQVNYLSHALGSLRRKRT